MAFETILFEVRNQIAWVTLNRPESMNADQPANGARAGRSMQTS